tara:strand:+ start:320 stop:760 length:441 start_codon:yes stop_codon:yes gene_type:complete
MLDYQKILNENMINVLKDILNNIKKNGLENNNHLFITFLTCNENVEVSKWLKERYPDELTIVIQYEYYNLEIYKDFFEITLSFNDIKERLKITYDSIISFADPSANFGLKLSTNYKNKTNKKIVKKDKDNVINFSKFKKINQNSND